MQQNNRNNREIIGNDRYRFISILYAFSPILVIYASPIPGLAINELIAAILFVYFALTNHDKLLKIDLYLRPLFFYILYGIFITLFVIFTEDWVQSNVMIYDLFGKLLFFILLLVGVKYVLSNILIKYLFILADFTVFFLFFQFILGFVGIHISGIIPFLPLSNQVDTATFISGQLGSERICAIFSEPAHLSEFLLLPFVIQCFQQKKSIWRILAYGVAIILSKSTTGFSVLGVIGIVFIINKIKLIHKNSIRIVFITFIALLIIGATPIFLMYFGDRLDRFSEISGDGNGLFSGYIRVLRGYILYNDYSLTGKIFGDGFGCILGYISSHKTDYLSLTDKIPEYVNSIQYILITTGIIGAFLISKFIYKIYRNCPTEFKVILITLIVMMTSSAFFFSTMGILYLIIAIQGLTKKSHDFNNNTNL